jgi:hypothetical protein
VGCPACGAVARAKDRRPTWVRDLLLAGRPVIVCWVRRIWSCPQPLCEQRTWTERHAIAPRALAAPGRSSGSGDVGIAAAAKHAPRQLASGVPEEARSVVDKRYEVRVSGSLSERARNAFPTMDVTSIPTQTIVFGELAGPSDLRDLLARCNAMGIEVLSLRQLPGDAASPAGTHSAVDEGERASVAIPPSRSTDPPEAPVARACRSHRGARS